MPQDLPRALDIARRALAILERQAAGYTSLTLPAHLQIELEEKRAEVARLAAQETRPPTPASSSDLYSDDARRIIAQRFYEPQLAALGLDEAQLTSQSPAELARSLERLQDALTHPEAFGVLRLKLTPQGYVVALASSTYHYEMTIAPLLLARKQWIEAQLRAASPPVKPDAAPCADLEIHVLPRSGDAYPVDLTLNGEHVWRGRMAADVTAWAASGDPAADGRRLFAALFADPDLRNGWAEARGLARERRIRLWLDVDEPALHTLPWELLRDETLLLAANARTPFSRYLPGRREWGAPALERPLRMLAVLANPADLAEYKLAPLDVAAERQKLAEALGDTDALQLDVLEPPVTLSRLEARLRAHPYHILHYVGHGAFGARREQAALYLEDRTGQAQVTRDEALSGMLERLYTPPLLVFLAACRSGTRSPRATFAGLAPQIARAGIPAVVAMQDDVAIAATHALSAAFYPQLLAHGRVDRALNEARSALLTAGHAAEVAAPVLLMRLRDGKMFEMGGEA
jgi:hypothetical protein